MCIGIRVVTSHLHPGEAHWRTTATDKDARFKQCLKSCALRNVMNKSKSGAHTRTSVPWCWMSCLSRRPYACTVDIGTFRQNFYNALRPWFSFTSRSGSRLDGTRDHFRARDLPHPETGCRRTTTWWPLCIGDLAFFNLGDMEKMKKLTRKDWGFRERLVRRSNSPCVIWYYGFWILGAMLKRSIYTLDLGFSWELDR